MNAKTKLWLGVGAFALVGAGTTPDPTGGPIIGKAALARHAAHPAAGGEGGEAGGEAGEASPSPASRPRWR